MTLKPLSDSLIKERTNAIILTNKERLKDVTFSDFPLVSIIILNRNGENLLDNLFSSIKENTIYPNYEIIILDNESIDSSLKLITTWSNNLPINLIYKNNNQSFSHGNNIAAQHSKGDLLLFLNNDIEVTFGWLTELVRIFFEYNDVGCVGGKLLYPFLGNNGNNIKRNFRIQHSGIAIKKTNRVLNPYIIGQGLTPYDISVDSIKEPIAVTGSMLLIKKDLFNLIDGFTESYNYGLEDVDLCLKSLLLGYKTIYTPNSLAFHFESATIQKESFSLLHNRSLENLKIFNHKWGEWLLENPKYISLDK